MAEIERVVADPVPNEDEVPAADAVPRPAPRLPSLIGHTVVMKGTLTVGEDLVIEGTFDGTITGSGHDSITVRRLARISGELSATDLLIEDGTNLQNTVLNGRIRLAESEGG